jgi:uncharacterized integral membrane protein
VPTPVWEACLMVPDRRERQGWCIRKGQLMSEAKQPAPTPQEPPRSRRATGRMWDFTRQHWWMLTAVVVAVHLLAWTVNNPEKQQVHWILFTKESPIGLVIAVAVVLGALLTLLIQRQRELGSSDRRVGKAGPQGS